jgi:hypothetical protein
MRGAYGPPGSGQVADEAQPVEVTAAITPIRPTIESSIYNIESSIDMPRESSSLSSLQAIRSMSSG